MHRFFCEFKISPDNTINLSDKKHLHHIRDVLRLKTGEKITLVDDRSREYLCAIGEYLEESINLTILKQLNKDKMNKVNLTIACSIPKRSKMEDIIDRLTQLGVERIIPLETERVIVRLDKNKKTQRLERWKKISQTASEQSQRNTLPVIDPVTCIEDVFRHAASFDLKLIPTLEDKRKNLKDVLNASKAKNILVLIGPEGDFSPQEIKLAKNAGFIPISLGNLVLRVETAAVAVASFIMLNENH